MLDFIAVIAFIVGLVLDSLPFSAKKTFDLSFIGLCLIMSVIFYLVVLGITDVYDNLNEFVRNW